ncbi:hypothetical protein RYA05_01440 [Pseudomonas syringae pv. actinidiae]|nr:hypothetical protein [Pseudomonas syringae pv. actinidiae]
MIRLSKFCAASFKGGDAFDLAFRKIHCLHIIAVKRHSNLVPLMANGDQEKISLVCEILCGAGNSALNI